MTTEVLATIDAALHDFRHVTFVSTKELSSHLATITPTLVEADIADVNVDAALQVLVGFATRVDTEGNPAETAPAERTVDALLDLRQAVTALVAV